MGKLSALPTETTIAASDFLVKVKAAGAGDVVVTFQNLLNAFFGGAGGTSWTPSFTNFTLGNGTVVASYVQIGKMVFFKGRVTLGSTSSVGASPTFTPPVTANTTIYNLAQNIVCGEAWFKAGSAQSLGSIMFNGSSTIMQLIYLPTSTTVSGISSTTPGTWTTGDYFNFQGWYEAA